MAFKTRTFRDKPTYLTQETWRAMWLLARRRTALAADRDSSAMEQGHITTVEEMVDLILRKYVLDHAPQLFEHQARIDKLEREMLETLRLEGDEL